VDDEIQGTSIREKENFMQAPNLNGVQKPADVIAHGPHRFNEATRKYEEIQNPPFYEYPKAMWHETEPYVEATSRAQEQELTAKGYRTKPFPPKAAAKDTTVVPAADLAMIVLQQNLTMQEQARQMETMQQELARLTANLPTTAPAIPEEPKRSRASKVTIEEA